MRLDHLLSREYTTTDLVQVAWREGSFEFVGSSCIVFKAREAP